MTRNEIMIKGLNLGNYLPCFSCGQLPRLFGWELYIVLSNVLVCLRLKSFEKKKRNFLLYTYFFLEILQSTISLSLIPHSHIQIRPVTPLYLLELVFFIYIFQKLALICVFKVNEKCCILIILYIRFCALVYVCTKVLDQRILKDCQKMYSPPTEYSLQVAFLCTGRSLNVCFLP